MHPINEREGTALLRDKFSWPASSTATTPGSHDQKMKTLSSLPLILHLDGLLFEVAARP